MKQILSLLLLFIYVTTVKSQVKIITKIDTSLFVGVDNIVTIESTSIPANELTLYTKACIIQGKGSTVKLLCRQPGRDVTLNVFHKNKIVATKKININRISDPVAYVLGEKLFTDTVISKKQLSTMQSLVTKTNYPLANFTVVSYTAEIVHDSKSSGTVQHAGRDISKEIKTLLSYAVAGDKVIFDQVRVLCPDGAKRFVPPVKLMVTE